MTVESIHAAWPESVTLAFEDLVDRVLQTRVVWRRSPFAHDLADGFVEVDDGTRFHAGNLNAGGWMPSLVLMLR